jgi:hypothetical protein
MTVCRPCSSRLALWQCVGRTRPTAGAVHAVPVAVQRSMQRCANCGAAQHVGALGNAAAVACCSSGTTALPTAPGVGQRQPVGGGQQQVQSARSRFTPEHARPASRQLLLQHTWLLTAPSPACPRPQVVVHNLPWNCTWQQLKDAFKEWKVQRADVAFDSWGRSRWVAQPSWQPCWCAVLLCWLAMHAMTYVHA